VWPGDRPPLAQQTVRKLEGVLRAARYVGPIDLNAIITDDGTPHGLEWSARLGFDASQAYSMLVEGDYGDQLARFAAGTLQRWDVREDQYAMTLRVTTPPYPTEPSGPAKQMAGIPLDPMVLSNSYRIFPCDVRKDRTGPCLAGWSGYVCAVGELAGSLARCRKAVLGLAKALDIPEKQYRIDPVHRAEDAFASLSKQGIAA
jgi:phosphoribosylamine-glycine ligase